MEAPFGSNQTCISSASQTKVRKVRPDDGGRSYRGVRRRQWGRWVSENCEPRKKSRIWLRTHETAEMAAKAHDAASLAIKGQPAHLNFPELADVFPRPSSNSPKDVWTAAALAAAIEYPMKADAAFESSSGDAQESSVRDDQQDDSFQIGTIHCPPCP